MFKQLLLATVIQNSLELLDIAIQNETQIISVLPGKLLFLFPISFTYVSSPLACQSSVEDASIRTTLWEKRNYYVIALYDFKLTIIKSRIPTQGFVRRILIDYL